MENAQKKKALKRLQEIVGSQLVQIYRCGDMPGLMFHDEHGKRIAIHSFSHVALYEDNKTVVDSDDIYVPAEGIAVDEDDVYDIGECQFDVSVEKMATLFPLKAEGITITDDGAVTIEFERGYQCVIQPWPDDEDEAWRVFYPGRRNKHLVYYGDGKTIYE